MQRDGRDTSRDSPPLTSTKGFLSMIGNIRVVYMPQRKLLLFLCCETHLLVAPSDLNRTNSKHNLNRAGCPRQRCNGRCSGSGRSSRTNTGVRSWPCAKEFVSATHVRKKTQKKWLPARFARVERTPRNVSFTEWCRRHQHVRLTHVQKKKTIPAPGSQNNACLSAPPSCAPTKLKCPRKKHWYRAG